MSYNPNAGGGAALSGQNIWEKPLSPNPLDDEFEDDPLDPAWVYTGFGAPLGFGTPPDPYANLGSSGHRAATAQHRSGPGGGGSWLKMQLDGGSGNGGIQKPLGALPTNQFYYARLQCNWRNQAADSVNDNKIALTVFETGQMATSIPLNGCNVCLVDTDRSGAEIESAFWGRAGSGFVDVQFTTARKNAGDSNRAWSSMSGYVAIQKLGLVYHAWLAHSEQGWMYMGNMTNGSGAAWDSIAVWGSNVGGTSPGNMIIGVDFVRVVDSAVFLP